MTAVVSRFVPHPVPATGNTEDPNVANTQGEAQAESPKEPEPLEGTLHSLQALPSTHLPPSLS